MAIFDLDASNVLIFNQTAYPGHRFLRASNTLVFRHDTRINIKYLSASNRLNFRQVASIGGSIYHRHAQHFLFLRQAAWPRVIDTHVNHVLHFVQTTRPVHGASNTLRFVQSTAYQKIKAVRQHLIFNQRTHLQKHSNLAIHQQLAWSHGATYYKSRSAYCTTQVDLGVYTPGTVLNNILLSLGAISVQLPAPDFNNAENAGYQVATKHTRGGDLYQFRDPQWPKDFILKYTWTGLNRLQVADLETFLERTLGQIITVVDYENRIFTGIVTNHDDTVTQRGQLNYNCNLLISVIV